SVDGIHLSPDAIKLDPNNELLTIALPNELPAGEHTIALEFGGKITPKGRGLYYMPYQEQGTGAKKVALGTQFEPSDARRFFPCWDEPSFRARFQRSEEHTSELQSRENLVCRLLLEKKMYSNLINVSYPNDHYTTHPLQLCQGVLLH